MDHFTTHVISTDDSNWMNASQQTHNSITSWTQQKCPLFEFIMSTVITGFLTIMGLVLNTLSFVVLSRDKNNEVATFLLKSLSMADNSVLLISLILLSMVHGPYQIPAARPIVTPAIPYMRVIANPMAYVAQSCSIWLTVLLAVNRFVAVCYPFLSERCLTLRLARIQVAAIVTISFLVNLPRFFLYKVVYVEETRQNNITIPARYWYKSTSLIANETFNLYYLNIFYTSVILILPLIVLIVFNLMIILTIKKSSNRLRMNSLNLKVSNQERNLTVVMIVIIVELLFCHTLDRVILIIKYVMITSPLKPSLNCPYAINYASHVGNLLIIINSSTDFFIYVFFKKRFRMLLRQLCRCFPCCREKRKVSTVHRPSTQSQTSNDIKGMGCLKQMELTSGHYRQLASSNSIGVDRSPSDCVFVGNGEKKLLF